MIKLNHNLAVMLSAMLLVIIVSPASAQDPKYEWCATIGGSNYEGSFSVVTDSKNDIIFAGYFDDTTDFDPGPGEHIVIPQKPSNMFILKLDSKKKLIWVKTLNNDCTPFNIATDSKDNIYITGWFSGENVDFDPGPDTYFLTSYIYNIPTLDQFVLKLNSNGNFVYANNTGGVYFEMGKALATDYLNNLIVSGYYTYDVDFDPGNSKVIFTSNGIEDIFIQKFNASGSLIWACSVGGTQGDECNSVTTDKFGNIYATGFFQDTVDFDPGPDTFNLISNGKKDIFILKLNKDGDFMWAKSYGSRGNDEAYNIRADNFGNIYITGYFYDRIKIQPNDETTEIISKGASDIFIFKLHQSGKMDWAKSYGYFYNDWGNDVYPDNYGNIYACGSFGPILKIKTKKGEKVLSSQGMGDNYFLKLDTFGNCHWAGCVGGNDIDNSYSIAVDYYNNIYFLGRYWNTADLDPTNDTDLYTSVSSWDIYLLKLSDIQTDINKPVKEVHANVWPNPSSEKVTIEFQKSYPVIYLSLYDSKGSLVSQQKVKNTSKTDVFLNGPKGTYFLKAKTSSGERYEFKLIRR